MKTYAVKTEFSFTGKFFVNAENKEAAREWVEHCCGLVMGGSIHTCLSEEQVDWEFPAHPEKTILNIRAIKVNHPLK